MRERALEGLRIVVCRPADSSSELGDALGAQGAVVVAAPVIETTDPGDGGAALRAALADLSDGDWLVVTSPNGARRVLAAPVDPAPGVKVAAVGPGTADVLRTAGIGVDLVPARSIAEGLLESFPDPPPGGGRVVLARASVARPVLPVGLVAAGWNVVDVAAYRTVDAPLDDATRRAVRGADAVAFTSSSTVDRLVAEVGVNGVPALVACIGPATEATARGHGLGVDVVAPEHTIPGLVRALVDLARSWT